MIPLRCKGVCAAALVLALVAFTGCVQPHGVRSEDHPQPKQTVRTACSAKSDIAALEPALERARTKLKRFVPTPDLIESLYFGWFDRPYRRATIATVFKTVALLERETRFRSLGNGAIRDGELAAMLDWLDDALDRAASPAYRPSFRPDRVGFDTASMIATGTDTPIGSPPRFAFVDRSSATRYDRAFGDFDLLVCLGTGAYGMSPRTAVFAGRDNELGARADALGIGIVTPSAEIVAVGASPAGEGDDASRRNPSQVDEGADLYKQVHPRTLAELLARISQVEGSNAIFAVIDPPRGETWGESLARRSLLRTIAPEQPVVATGWVSPGGEVEHPKRDRKGAELSAMQLAMWVHTLAGQRLGIIEGWRDFRDGSRLPYVSLATRPDRVETVAHTALDLLFYRRELAAWSPRPTVAVVIDDTAISAQNDNRWTPDAAKLFDALLDRQLHFEVVPIARASRRGTLGGYHTVLNAASRTDIPVLASARSGSFTELSKYLVDLPEPLIGRDLRNPADFIAYDPNGRVASGCLVFNGRAADGKPCFAVANLRARTCLVVIKSAAYSGNPPFRDVLTDETIVAGGNPVNMAGHQVRLFVPAERNVRDATVRARR